MWASIGILVGAVVAVVIFLLQRERKVLAYEVLTKVSLLTAREKAINGLEIRFHNESMTNARLLIVRFLNSGNRPILATDFERSVSISFPAGARVLAAEVIDAQPHALASELEATIDADTSRVMISPALLNVRDNFECRLLVDGVGEPQFSARVVGVKSIEPVRDKGWLLQAVALLLMAFAFALTLWGPRTGPAVAQLDGTFRTAGNAAMAAAVCILMFALWRTVQRTRKRRGIRRRGIFTP